MSDRLRNIPKKIRKSGDLENTKRKAWHAILTVYAVMLDEDSNRSTRLRAGSILSKMCKDYSELLSNDYEMRIQAIEESIEEIKNLK